MVSRAEFDRIFPNRSAFYTYDDFFRYVHLGTRTQAAQFLANVHHESGGLTAIEEEPGRRSVYCDRTRPYGCPAGARQYYGRGPVQLSWNYNYEAAGKDLGVDLLNHPDLVSRDGALAWRTAEWFWRQVPAGASFADTIRIINGPMECGGKRPELVQSRVNAYLRISSILGVQPSGDLYC
ncbi:chitinase [Gordonia sp. NPDC003424]